MDRTRPTGPVSTGVSADNEQTQLDDQDRLTVYFDRSCPLCRQEIETLKRADTDGRLRLVDCSTDGFGDGDAAAANLSQTELMQALHIRSDDGAWHSGPEAFAQLYRAAGLHGIARIWGTHRLRWLTTLAYRMIARYRGALRRSGLGFAYLKIVDAEIERRERRRKRDQAAT
ncbi:MAG: DUF393 domain-containing protein [Pseudomonadota bacterium]